VTSDFALSGIKPGRLHDFHCLLSNVVGATSRGTQIKKVINYFATISITTIQFCDAWAIPLSTRDQHPNQVGFCKSHARNFGIEDSIEFDFGSSDVVSDDYVLCIKSKQTSRYRCR
jgi:hypothetical protein